MESREPPSGTPPNAIYTLFDNSSVVMDNASFHKSPTTRTLIESKGCTLKYLPTYSPDLNPIEPQWAILKARLRKHKTPHQSLDKAVDQIFAMY